MLIKETFDTTAPPIEVDIKSRPVPSEMVNLLDCDGIQINTYMCA